MLSAFDARHILTVAPTSPRIKQHQFFVVPLKQLLGIKENRAVHLILCDSHTISALPLKTDRSSVRTTFFNIYPRCSDGLMTAKNQLTGGKFSHRFSSLDDNLLRSDLCVRAVHRGSTEEASLCLHSGRDFEIQPAKEAAVVFFSFGKNAMKTLTP